MRSGSRFFSSLSLVLVIGVTVAACGDDDGTDDSAQTGSDAGYETGGKSASAGRGGAGGSRATAGRSGSAGASVAGRAATAGVGAGTGGVPATQGSGGRGTPAAGSGGATAVAGSGPSAASLSDAQIAAVTTAANTGEIALGNIAVSRATLPVVRDFAQEMITMHGAAQDRSATLLQSLGITPVQNNLSTTLEQDAQRVAVSLQSALGTDFDLAYIRSQVDIHTQVLEIFDTVLLPSVTELALRTDLTLARGDVQRHLTEAQALLLIVQATPPDFDAGTEDAGL
jgi:putative membrane protein